MTHTASTCASPADVAAMLRKSVPISAKTDIASACAALGLGPQAPGRPGDDCAALPDDVGGWTLFAMEGFLPEFVAADPWFAGWCGVMVNLADIAAMGGRGTAITNAVWAPDEASAAPILEGMREAAARYDVPVVGGHSNLGSAGVNLAVSVLGRATRLITSFDARPGDALVAAVDLRGAYRAPFDNWQAALDAPAQRLRGDAALLPQLAEDGLINAGKDISQAGIVGTTLMLAEASGVAIEIDLGALHVPPGVTLERWLVTFPSYGFVLSVAPEHAEIVSARFRARGIAAGQIGHVAEGHAVHLSRAGAVATFWDYHETPYLGLTSGA